VTGNYARQVSPFGNPRIKVWLPTPRGLSQAPTSFIGSWCQGIHRVPLITWQLQMMLASTMQFSKYKQSQHPDRRQPQPANMTSTAEAVQRNAGLTQKNQAQAPVSSGPNSVPSPASCHDLRSSRGRVY
jgi:hypothetical protein